MAEAFWRVLNLSLAAGWLIAAVVVLRLVLRRAPRAIVCALWAIVAVRLLCPVSIESALSLIPSTETIPRAAVLASAPEVQSGPEASGAPLDTDSAVQAPAGETAPAASGSRRMERLGVLWLAGVAAMLGYAIFSDLRIRRRVREGTPLRENIWLCDRVDTPFILGLLRPRIYLPSAMDDARSAYVLAHETAHLKRRDHWWKPLGFALLAVYWFHPLCWLAYRLLCRDIELACDERVVRRWDVSERKAYAEALLACSVPRRAVAAGPLAFGESGIKERVRGVLRYRTPTVWLAAAAVAACIVAALCFLTNPAASRSFPLAGRNCTSLEPQLISSRIAAAEKLADATSLHVNSDNFDLLLTSEFDFAGDETVQFFYTRRQQTYGAQLRLFPAERTFFITERSKWPEQTRSYKLQSYLDALRCLPQEEIRNLSPEADRYSVRLLDGGSPAEYARAITYTPNGAEPIDGWLIHLECAPLHAAGGAYHGTGDEVIHLFYGGADLALVSLRVPEGLTRSAYSAELGTAGGWCLLPETYTVYETASAVTPLWWRTAGAIVSFRAEQVLRWDGDTIAGLNVYANHTLAEGLEPISGLCAPAYLARVTYDLYTAAELEALWQQGIRVADGDAVSEYWCLYFARPGEALGYMLSLDARQFSREDLLALGASFDYSAAQQNAP